MSTPAATPRRTSIILLATVALFSALAVVAVYELPAHFEGRRRRDGSAASEDPPAGVKQLPPRLRAAGRPPAMGAGAVTATASAPEETAPGPLSPEREQAETKRLAEWAAPPREVLVDLARRCELRLVAPAVMEPQAPSVDAETAAALSLSARERIELDRVLRSMHDEFTGAVRPLFTSGVGSDTPATLDEMISELAARPGSGFTEARSKLAEERAQLAPPPPPGAALPAGERFLRLWASLGDTYEQRLGQLLGPDRARQLRFSPHAAPWTSRYVYSGCPGAE